MYSNRALVHVYDDLLEPTSNHEEIKDAKDSLGNLHMLKTYGILSSDKRFTMGSKFQFGSINYDEDTWSERLFYCLLKRSPDIQAEFTARMRGIAKIMQHMEKKLPLNINLDTLNFWGAPDILVKQMPVFSAIDARDGDCDSSSDESLIFGHAFQQADLKSCSHIYVP